MKVKQTAHLILMLFSLAVFISVPSCEKKETPPQECKTCTAVKRTDGTLIKEQQACGEEQEQQFRSQYNPEFITVTCR